ncbi:cyclic lactone autoinducer peptide [Eubacterium sp.]
MKKIKNLMKKISPAIVGCLTLVLTINANTASCFILNEPKEPKSIEKFKFFK